MKTRWQRLVGHFLPDVTTDSNVRLVRLFSVLLVVVYTLELAAIVVVSYELAYRQVRVFFGQGC